MRPSQKYKAYASISVVKARVTSTRLKSGMKHKISVIIPVLNEAPIINLALDRIFSLPYDGEVEVILVDGSPDGETLAAVSRKEAIKLRSGKGRSCQMNKGALNACGDILLFLHADTGLPEKALDIISSIMGKGDYVGGAFDLGINSRKPVFRLIELTASLRSRVTRVPYGDQAFFIWKDHFHAIGGFKEIPIMEDVELMQRIKKACGKIHIIPEQAKTSPRRWEKEGVLFCTLRNWTLITLYFLGVRPEKLAKFYR